MNALALLVFVAAVSRSTAADRPFSHRIHLKLQPDCLACHTKAASSTSKDDNLLPDKSACRRCHKPPEVTINPPLPTMLRRFNHQLHLKMGNVAPVIRAAIESKQYLSPPDDIRRHLNTKNACEACHRGLEESGRVTKAAFPQMADCLVCHSKIDPPFSCQFCHAADAKLTPPTHTQEWVDIHSSGKLTAAEKQTCAVCHGRNFTCQGCH